MSIMYHTQLVFAGTPMVWNMRGMNHGEPKQFSLVFGTVTLPGGYRGIVMNHEVTHLPEGVEISENPDTAVRYKGQTVWIEGRHGLAVDYEGVPYPLFAVCQVGGDSAELQFTFLPTGLSDGQIVFYDELWPGEGCPV